MISIFFDKSEDVLLKYKNISYLFVCIATDKRDNVLPLQNPKLIYDVDELKSTASQKVIAIDKHFTDISIISTQHVDSNFSAKFDKKNKSNIKQEDNNLIDNKKNKVKTKKKTRNKIDIDQEDAFMAKTSNRMLTKDALDISLERPLKPNKQKKKAKIKPVAVNNNSDYLNTTKNAENYNARKNTDNTIIIDKPLTIQELSAELNIPEAEIITWLFLKGISATINQVVDISIAKEVARNYNFNVSDIKSPKKIIHQTNKDINLDQGIKRPPVITILGHVDHGKTTLLDAIRNTNIVHRESGGITQTIRGYEINWLYDSSTEKLVFLDTPGHEAFTSMRSLSTQVTDIAILVVAADDGLKPQSIEAIEHIISKKLPCIVVINKVDKSNINIEYIQEELAKYNLISEQWGGNTPIVEVSALTGKNIDVLLSKICLLSLKQSLKADPNKRAQGTILEAYLDKTKGPIANVIIQNGTLKIGDIIVSGNIYGKVKVILNNYGIKVDHAIPSSAVEVLGFSSIPNAGAHFEVFQDEKTAKQAITHNSNNINKYKITQLLNTRVRLDTYNNQIDVKQLNVILKTDTQGSIEAIIYSFAQIPQNKVQINILAANPGNISDTDIELALTSKSLLIGFNINVSSTLFNNISKLGIITAHFSVIYDLLEYIQEYMLSLVELEYDKVLIGQGTVRDIFYINKGAVAGCFVDSGKFKKLSSISIYRKNEVIYNGILDSLKRIKDDVAEVNAGNECGVMCNDYHLWHKDDIIKVYDLNEKPKRL